VRLKRNHGIGVGCDDEKRVTVLMEKGDLQMGCGR